MKTENVIIIGGGPAGLAAAIYTSRADLQPLVISGSPPGGQLMLTTEVENYPGIDSILGPKLIDSMRKHAVKFKARLMDENVSHVDFSKKPLEITLQKGEKVHTKTVLITTGANAKWLGLESEQRLRGKGVSACATCDGFFFKGKDVAVVGGGDAAMEEALTLTGFAKKIYIIHRRDEFRASKIMQKRVLANKKINVIWNAEVKKILGDNQVEGVELTQSEHADSTKNILVHKKLEVQGVFIAIGHTPNTEFLKTSRIDIDEKGYIYTTGRYAWEVLKDPKLVKTLGKYDVRYQYQTNKKGVFAAGDVVDYTYRQAATAVGMGVAAALDVERFLGENS
jgi:thioredoxin reductase (NADPH)